MSARHQDSNSRVAYVVSLELLKAADTLPSNLGRASLVHDLIASFNLIGSRSDTAIVARNRLLTVRSIPATREQLLVYHDEEYIGQYWKLLPRLGRS